MSKPTVKLSMPSIEAKVHEIFSVIPIDQRGYYEKTLVAVRNRLFEYRFEARLAQRNLAAFHNDSGHCEKITNSLGQVQKLIKELEVQEELLIDLLAERETGTSDVDVSVDAQDS